MRTIFSTPRNSIMEIGEVYFWTSTVYEWYKLFEQDQYKTCLTDSLTYLHNANLIKVYGFSIMPNHMHIIWELLKMNGKDKPNASFTKYTAHKIIEDLKLHNPKECEKYVVTEHDRSHRVPTRNKDYEQGYARTKAGLHTFKSYSTTLEFGKSTRSVSFLFCRILFKGGKQLSFFESLYGKVLSWE